MNFELGPDELALVESARDAFSRSDTLGAARSALDGAPLPHHWDTAVKGGWNDMPGLLYGMLVLIEAGRRLAPTGLVGHLAAAAVHQGEGRLAFFTSLDFVPDAMGADALVGGTDTLVLVRGATITPVGGYDLTRPLGNIDLTGAQVTPLDGDLKRGWYVQQALLAAEALGAAEAALELAVGYAKERAAFGRRIGSFQAIKHRLTNVLRLNENARSLLYYAAYALEHKDFGLAACAARLAADKAVDEAAQACLAVHGGIGATWEHDAHLYFRRAQLARLLLGGPGPAQDVVAEGIYLV